MALRNEDKTWISNEIRIAIDAVKPRGWRRATHLLRDWGILGTVFSIIVALLGLTLSSAYVAVSRVGKQATFEAETAEKLNAINTHLVKIDAVLLSFQIADLSKKPITDQSSREAQRLLSDAQAAALKLPRDVIQESGERYIAAAKYVPTAWDAGLAFVNYNSLNGRETVSLPPMSLERPASHYYQQNLPGMPEPTFSSAGTSPKYQAAQFIRIGEDLDADASSGPTILFARGGTIALDGMRLKNMVLVGVRIRYSGSALQLENVQFVNCTFEMPYTKNGESVALAELRPSDAINLTAV